MLYILQRSVFADMAQPEEGMTYPHNVDVEPGMPEGWYSIEKQNGPKEHHIVTMYADEVDPHRTHQYTNLTMGVRADDL